MNFQFGKQRKLLKRAEFNHVFQNGKRFSTPGFVLIYIKNTFGFARLGFVISKKNIPKAHDRNRIRRVVKESFRKNPNIAGYDVVFLAKKDLHLMASDVNQRPKKNVNSIKFREAVEAIWCKLINLSAK